jgi:hypothetical protein
MPEAVDDIVCVLPWSIMEGAVEDDVIVCDRPGGGAAPKMLE